jgi:hypothetical protein
VHLVKPAQVRVQLRNLVTQECKTHSQTHRIILPRVKWPRPHLVITCLSTGVYFPHFKARQKTSAHTQTHSVSFPNFTRSTTSNRETRVNGNQFQRKNFHLKRNVSYIQPDRQCTYNVTKCCVHVMFIPSRLPDVADGIVVRFYGNLMSLASKVPHFFCPVVTKHGFSQNIFMTVPNTKFHVNHDYANLPYQFKTL